MQNKSTEIIAGEVFYDLTLTGNVSFMDTKEGKRMYVEAKCICGVIKSYPLRYLKTGNTKSCGCVRRRKIIEATTTHGYTNHPLYSVYQDMKRRCYDSKCQSYKDYGGRGIKVCDEWLDDVKSFCDWGMVNGYQKGLELDKINNYKNYEPSNCRFVTRAKGNVNMRRVKQILAFGESKCIAEWTIDNRCTISPQALKNRLIGGWDAEKAIVTPSNKK